MTVTPAAPAARTAADFTPEQLDLRERARRFVDEVLIPNEELAERSGGKIPDELKQRIKREAVEARLSGGLHAVEHGGQGWSKVEWFLVEEQLGRSTNALSWHMPGAYNVLGLRVARADRALPEAGAARRAARRLRRDRGGGRLRSLADRHNGAPYRERLGDRRREVVRDLRRRRERLHRHGERARRRRAASRRCSWWTGSSTASRSSTSRPSRHTYPHGHPTVRFSGVEVAEDAVIGGIGGGDDLQRSWFTEERIGIAARGVGSMWRLIEDATAWAIEREQGGNRIIDYQGVSFPLADSAADAAAGRLLAIEVARLADAGADPKVVHAKASMAKLFVSEAANRCADRCLQIFGGRGYMRTNVAERFFRELRVDSIWEGTSEIQRLIIARALERRGVERTLH